MELMLNELSLHGQFNSHGELHEAIGRIMRMRGIARDFSREVYCHSNALNSLAGLGMPLVRMFSRDQRTAMMQWLTRQGPFWEDAPKHSHDEYFECGTEVVTGSGLAEAAFCSTIGVDRRMVSFAPSEFAYSPIVVTWRKDNRSAAEIPLGNFWDPAALEAELQLAERPLESWRQLEELCRRRFGKLNFAENCFRSLNGQPFGWGVAKGIMSRMDVLNRLSDAGMGSGEGRQLYEKHFMGDRAWFSDSSDREKREFKQELTFPSPDPDGEALFCTWHGKLNTPPYRIHFDWPFPDGGRIYVVYLGLKITR